MDDRASINFFLPGLLSTIERMNNVNLVPYLRCGNILLTAVIIERREKVLIKMLHTSEHKKYNNGIIQHVNSTNQNLQI